MAGPAAGGPPSPSRINERYSTRAFRQPTRPAIRRTIRPIRSSFVLHYTTNHARTFDHPLHPPRSRDSCVHGRVAIQQLNPRASNGKHILQRRPRRCDGRTTVLPLRMARFACPELPFQMKRPQGIHRMSMPSVIVCIQPKSNKVHSPCSFCSVCLEGL
jgi:hypothetical protein